MIIQCPYCTSPVLKGMEELRHLAVSFSFEMRCPHCKQNIGVQMTFERTVIINQTEKTNKLGPENIRIIKQGE